MNHIIDLRSDTVTRPSPAMRRAMAEAEVGDDVYREDPTVNRLEQRAAQIFGREAGLFVPSGTMGNTIGIKVHTHHGPEAICVARPIFSQNGILNWDQIRPEIRPLHSHYAPTGVIELENTHNIAGGSVYPPEVFDRIADGAHEMGIRVHLDGARIFNAATYLGRPVHEITAKADTVMFCLSKGLGAPVGSMLVGTAETIAAGRLYRKRLGGGMRQAGILAAAGLIALKEGPARLCEDHANARFLADAFSRIKGIQIAHEVQPNIVIFDVAGTGLAAADLSARLKSLGALMNPVRGSLMRFVTHLDVTRADCEAAAEIFAQCLV